jgi:hypothetical protein
MSVLDGVNYQLRASVALSPGKQLPQSLNGKLGGSQHRSGPFGLERNFLPLPAISSVSPSTCVYVYTPEFLNPLHFAASILRRIIVIQNAD